jgi:transcriptional regulator with GAF, ATPase, and Fis domain
MTVKLKLTHGDNYREFEFDRREVKLGRGPSNDLVIDDLRLSRIQGRIHCAEGRARFTFEGGCTTRHTRAQAVLDSARDDNQAEWFLEPGDVLEIDGDAPIRVELLDVSTPRGPLLVRLTPAPAVEAPVATWLDRLSRDPSLEALVDTLAEHYRGEGVRVVVSLHTEEDEFLNEVVASRADDDSEPSIYADPIRLLGTLGSDLLEAWGEDFFVAVTPSRSGATRLVIPVSWNAEVGGVVALEWDRELTGDELDEVGALLTAFEPAARIALRCVANDRSARSLAEENRYFRERERRHYHFKELICESPRMRAVYDALNAQVDDDHPVLITGEAGTGKELMARALHHLGRRRDGMMITLNCGRLQDETLDYELFGCASSQLEGAVASRKGVFELAADGTVFLEEVDKLTPLMQGKLVRMLKEREVRRIGEAVGRGVRARVVASIHRDLNELVQSGHLRRDLYLLLKQHVLEVPSLRDRHEDILPLARTFVRTYSERYDAELKLSPEAANALLAHDWPGNVRELQTRIEAAVLDCEHDAITTAHLGL